MLSIYTFQWKNGPDAAAEHTRRSSAHADRRRCG